MFGVFGETLDQAKQTEFFIWFHLEETANEPQAGNTVVSFRPTSSQFHSLVCVQMTLGGDQRLRSAVLLIQRAFIDHSESFTFAADIAKSFLVAALDEPDLDMVAEAAVQIRGYQPAGSRMTQMFLRGSGPTAVAPGEGEPEFLTYAGKRRRLEKSLVAMNLEMVNGLVDGVEHLTVRISPK